jgi:hypothetical protein
VEASEGGVVDCTGSEFSSVEVSGEAATGSAASGAAASGGGPSAVNVHSTGSAHSSAAPGADGEARATGGGVERSEGAAVGEGGSGVVRICVDRSCFRGDNGGGVRGVGDVVVVERGDRSCGVGEAWRGERRSVFSPSSILSSSASHRLFTALLVRLAGGGDGVIKLRGVGESSGPEGSVGEDSGTRGACTTWFVASPTAVFRGRRRRLRRRGAV